MTDIRSDHDGYISKVCAFLGTQDYLASVSPEAFRGARQTSDLGITSLGAIALVASYIRKCGLDDSNFKPEWVPMLGEVTGIVMVFREIDSLATRASEPAAEFAK
jgi:hypothetical protein